MKLPEKQGTKIPMTTAISHKHLHQKKKNTWHKFRCTRINTNINTDTHRSARDWFVTAALTARSWEDGEVSCTRPLPIGGERYPRQMLPGVSCRGCDTSIQGWQMECKRAESQNLRRLPSRCLDDHGLGEAEGIKCGDPFRQLTQFQPAMPAISKWSLPINEGLMVTNKDFYLSPLS